MVVGVLKSLEEGRVYSYHDLSCRFGLRGRDLDRALDDLVARGHVAPMLYSREHGVSFLPVFERDLSWMAVRRAS